MDNREFEEDLFDSAGAKKSGPSTPSKPTRKNMVQIPVQISKFSPLAGKKAVKNVFYPSVETM